MVKREREAHQYGSIYHLSSLRYADPNSGGLSASYSGNVTLASSGLIPEGVVVEGEDKRKTRVKERLSDRLFEQAEDDYRAGQSSSSSLLIKSNYSPIVVPNAKDQGQEGFQRTKARALLASSTLIRDVASEEDAVLSGLKDPDHGNSSIYLHNRRAKHPLSRLDYEKIRKRRLKNRLKGKATLGARGEQEEEEENNEDDFLFNNDDDNNQIALGRAEEIKRQIDIDAEALTCLLPGGSLMATIHYLAAHYLDARSALHSRDVGGGRIQESQSIGVNQAPQSDSNEEEDEESSEYEEGGLDSDPTMGQADKSRMRNMLRVCDGNALVALAIFLEETVKYESAAESSTSLHDNSRGMAEEVRKADDKRTTNKRKRVAQDRKKVSSARRYLDNGWAISRRREKHVRTSELAKTTERLIELQSSNEGDGNGDEEEEEEEEGEEGSDNSLDD